METKELETKEAWREFWLHDHREHSDTPEYLVAISDLKIAIIEALNEEIKECLDCRNSYPKDSEAYAEFSNRANGLHSAISLVKTVTPKKK